MKEKMVINFGIYGAVPENNILERYVNDWNYMRSKRSTRTNLSFTDFDVGHYWYALVKTPNEYRGKIAGHIGYAIYNDLITDAGAYTLGGKATEENENIPNFRGNNIYTELRERRNKKVEATSKIEGKPFIVVLTSNNTNAITYYSNRDGYVRGDTNIPEWALGRLKGKIYFVYNSSIKKSVQSKNSWFNIFKINLQKQARRIEDVQRFVELAIANWEGQVPETAEGRTRRREILDLLNRLGEIVEDLTLLLRGNQQQMTLDDFGNNE